MMVSIAGNHPRTCRRLRDNDRAPVCKETESAMPSRFIPRIRHPYISPYDAILKASAEKCLERSRHLLLETGDMVDSRQRGKPLQRPKTAADALRSAH